MGVLTGRPPPVPAPRPAPSAELEALLRAIQVEDSSEKGTRAGCASPAAARLASGLAGPGKRSVRGPGQSALRARKNSPRLQVVRNPAGHSGPPGQCRAPGKSGTPGQSERVGQRGTLGQSPATAPRVSRPSVLPRLESGRQPSAPLSGQVRPASPPRLWLLADGTSQARPARTAQASPPGTSQRPAVRDAVRGPVARGAVAREGVARGAAAGQPLADQPVASQRPAPRGPAVRGPAVRGPAGCDAVARGTVAGRLRAAQRGTGHRPRTHQVTAADARVGARSRRRAGRAGSVRLTRRGRVVLALLLAGLALLAMGLTAAAQAQAASSGPSAGAVKRSMTRVVVMPGQTLWSIALRAEPAADPRVVIQQIADVNGLRTTNLQPGEQLWVPRG